MQWSHYFPLWPPSLNHAWRSAPMSKNPYLSDEVRRFRKEMYAEILVARSKHQIPRGTIEGPVAVTLRFYPPDLRRWDLDNRPKAIFDALTHAMVWLDDEQVYQLDSAKCQVNPHDGGFWMCLRTLS